MVVGIHEGREAVRAYVQEQASRGLEHVCLLVAADNERLLSLVGDLGDDEAVGAAGDEWSVFQVMRHLAASLERSRARLETLSTGLAYSGPPAVPGGMGEVDYASFGELRAAYTSGMAAIIAVLDAAEDGRGLDQTADHAIFGPFDWLEWAVYSHHVHLSDHIGQVEALRRSIRAQRASAEAGREHPMVVSVNEPAEAIRAYVQAQAARGPAHVAALVGGSRNRLMALLGPLSAEDAAYKPSADEWSVSDALHHLTGGYERSKQRIAALSSGQEFASARPNPGSLPDAPRLPFEEQRRVFDEGQRDVSAIVQATPGGANLALRADHPFGSFNWLEWAVFSHHVHVHDHTGQIEALVRAIEARRRG